MAVRYSQKILDKSFTGFRARYVAGTSNEVFILVQLERALMTRSAMRGDCRISTSLSSPGRRYSDWFEARNERFAADDLGFGTVHHTCAVAEQRDVVVSR